MNFIQIQTIIALNFIAIPITKRYNLNYKVHTVKPCVPNCHICGRCRHRCSYLGCSTTVEIRKRPRCAVERDWSASGFPRKALNRCWLGPRASRVSAVNVWRQTAAGNRCCVFLKVSGRVGGVVLRMLTVTSRKPYVFCGFFVECSCLCRWSCS